MPLAPCIAADNNKGTARRRNNASDILRQSYYFEIEAVILVQSAVPLAAIAN